MTLQTALAGGIDDVLKQFEAEELALNTKKVTALAAYITANPAAEDLAQAYQEHHFLAKQAELDKAAQKFLQPWLDSVLKEEKPAMRAVSNLSKELSQARDVNLPLNW